MNYEQKYKEALERAKKLYEQGTITESLGYVFPELKESEDERIRKAIYNALKYLETELSWDFIDEVDILDVYDWLEKQSEKKNTRKRETDDAYLQGICDAKHEIEKQGEKKLTENAELQNYIFNVNQLKKDLGL